MLVNVGAEAYVRGDVTTDDVPPRLPQQCARPVVVRPQVKLSPAEICWKVRTVATAVGDVAGAVVPFPRCPLTFRPPQKNEPAMLSAQLCPMPAAEAGKLKPPNTGAAAYRCGLAARPPNCPP